MSKTIVEATKPDPKSLPSTKAETAEERLEELVKNKSILKYYVVFENTTYYCFYPAEGECKAYPDGFEAVIKSNDEYKGELHIIRRNVFITYDLGKEYEKQNLQHKEEK